MSARRSRRVAAISSAAAAEPEISAAAVCADAAATAPIATVVDSGNVRRRRNVTSCSVSTCGTRVRTGPVLAGECRTSAPRSRPLRGKRTSSAYRRVARPRSAPSSATTVLQSDQPAACSARAAAGLASTDRRVAWNSRAIAGARAPR
jgi:hypothetical protein